MSNASNYNRNPVIPIHGYASEAYQESAILTALLANRKHQKTILVVDCYPGISGDDIRKLLNPISFDGIYCSDDCAYEPEKLDALWEPNLTDDRVFGIMTHERLENFFYSDRMEAVRTQLQQQEKGLYLVYGVGASLITKGDLLILADLSRWEIQLRYRNGMNNWRTAKKDLPILSKYKRGFFIEWRLADRHKKTLYQDMDFYLDMNHPRQPVMITASAFHAAMETAVKGPFRLVPYFDPGVWGGHWMKDTFGLPENGSNYAWSFDGVPEENSISFDFDGTRLEMPALNLVFTHPVELLGDRVHARFGTEFPIRFDFLDTMGGQNLSLQVHPLTEYIQEHFHMNYTQDESYYIMQAGKDACVYLGVKSELCQEEMLQNLKEAADGTDTFHQEKFINCFPVKQHDHVLIPAGTIHCSGKNTVVLEISATPYIFTFKLWDWDRLGLDGLPRPVHLQHGASNIQWERNTEWVERELLHQDSTLYENDGNLVQRTGLHNREFIDTFRFTLTKPVQVKRNGSVHMLNLVEGREVVVQSPTSYFDDFIVHYGETFILPEAAGVYTLQPLGNDPVRVILACVRGDNI